MRHRGLASSISLLAVLSVAITVAQEHEHGSPPGEKLGTVQFATSCTSAAQPHFDRAVALLHSFEFGPAVDAFNTTLKADSSCAISEWGIALSRWGNPFAVGARSAAQLQAGAEAIDRARALGPKTDRERAFVAAAARLYTDVARVPQQTRVIAYRDAMAALATTYDDTEASIFYALSLTASEDLNDKTYASRLKAGAILEALYAKYPDHPGLAHYIIHSYDVPALAPKALDAARRYAHIAPSAPHALHMPSHTFTRVGSWQESIETNIASAAAARLEHAVTEELHATDYQMYAYLQTAQDVAAKRLLDTLPEITARLLDVHATESAAPVSAAVFAVAAIPARWALERGAWAEAAGLGAHPSEVPYADALTYFAQALGAARSGRATLARTAIDQLRQLRDREDRLNEAYWTGQIEIQRRAASAWLAFAEGRRTDAVAEMRAAADAEDRTEKAAVTPGPIAPARELLGEMLLEMAQPARALKEFEATLVKEPNRFRSVYGAARAARLSGNNTAAGTYFTQLLHICERADKPGRPELQEARSVVRSLASDVASRGLPFRPQRMPDGRTSTLPRAPASIAR
jgi:hypothetical protein